MKERDWQAVNLADVEKQISDPNFLQQSACGCKMPIHTFRIVGDSLEGRLRPCPNRDRDDRAKAAHLFIPTKNGEIGVAIRLSKMLWAAIENENDRLWGKWIRITYRGSVRTNYGHAKKIYLVEVDRGAITESFETVPTRPTKNSKPRKRRPVRRPMAAAKT